MAVPVEVRDDAGLRQQVGTFEQSRRLERAVSAVPEDARASHHDDVDEAVAIEVVEQERVNTRVGVGASRRLQREDPLEGGWAAANEHFQAGRIDPCGGEVTVLVSLRGPLDREVALDGDPPFARPFARCRDDVQDDGDEGARGRIRLRRLESRVVPLGLDELVSPGCELADERRPFRRIEASARLGQREALDAVIQGFDGDRRTERDALERDAGQDIGLRGRIAAPVRCEEGVP